MADEESKNNNVIQFTNEIMDMKVNNPDIQTHSRFKEVLQMIPQLVENANKLLNTDIDDILDNNQEDEVLEIITKLKEPQDMVKEVKQARTNMRKAFKAQSDFYTAQFDKMLENAQFDQLEDIDKQVKQLKRDLSARRRIRRWDELKDTFEAQLDAYPIIETLAPELTDFSRVKMHQPKLVTGAKTAKITDKQRSVITNLVSKWAQDLEQLQQNSAGLTEDDLGELYHDYAQAFGDMSKVQNRINYYKQREEARRQAQIKAQKEAEERARQQKELEEKHKQQQAKLAKQQTSSNKVQPAPKPIQPTPQIAKPKPIPPRQTEPHATEPYKWLIDAILSNDQWRNGLMNPNRAESTKLTIIEALLKSTHKSGSFINKMTHNNQHEVYQTIKYIMDDLNML